MHLTVIKNHLEKAFDCTIPKEQELEWGRKDGRPLSSDPAKRSLKRTAAMYLGTRSQLGIHDWMDADQVTAQLVLIIRQRHADLAGKKKLVDIVGHVFFTYGTAYQCANDVHAFDVITAKFAKGFYLPERVAVLA